MRLPMHRVAEQNDWTAIPPNERNRWQGLAARTNGILTIGNIFTVIGFAVTMYGLVQVATEQYGFGLALVIIGRFCDLLDGWLADQTGTKSRLGEQLDAGVDKLVTLIALSMYIIYGVTHWWLIVALVVPHILIALVSAPLVLSGHQPHPSRAGKNSMALLWICLIGYICIRLFEAGQSYPAYAVYGLTILSALLGFAAAAGYVRQLLRFRSAGLSGRTTSR